MLLREDVQFVALDCSVNHHRLGGIEMCSVQIRHSGKTITVSSVYCPPSLAGRSRRKLRQLDAHVRHHCGSGEVLLLGDFNGHHRSLGYDGQNAMGVGLIDVAIQNGLILLNEPGEMTLLSRSGSATCPDAAFASRGVASSVSGWRLGDDVGSDHLPILFDVNAVHVANSVPLGRWRPTKNSLELYPKGSGGSVVLVDGDDAAGT